MRSEEDWVRLLRQSALASWGEGRVAELGSALPRMAAAIARVAARTPLPETTPLGPPPLPSLDERNG